MVADIQIHDFVFYTRPDPDGSTCWGNDGLEEGDALGSKVGAELNFKEDLRRVILAQSHLDLWICLTSVSFRESVSVISAICLAKDVSEKQTL